VSEVDTLSVDTEHASEGGFRHRHASPAIVTYPGQRSPRSSRFPRRWRGPRTNPGCGSAPERSGERITAVEAADRSRAAPELAGLKRAAPEKGFQKRSCNLLV
jgi:hypothetical protein